MPPSSSNIAPTAKSPRPSEFFIDIPFNGEAPCNTCTGDVDGNGEINALDIEPFLVALFEPESYAAQYPDCDINLADINGDGSINALDIEGFLGLLFP